MLRSCRRLQGARYVAAMRGGRVSRTSTVPSRALEALGLAQAVLSELVTQERRAPRRHARGAATQDVGTLGEHSVEILYRAREADIRIARGGRTATRLTTSARPSRQTRVRGRR